MEVTVSDHCDVSRVISSSLKSQVIYYIFIQRIGEKWFDMMPSDLSMHETENSLLQAIYHSKLAWGRSTVPVAAACLVTTSLPYPAWRGSLAKAVNLISGRKAFILFIDRPLSLSFPQVARPLMACYGVQRYASTPPVQPKTRRRSLLRVWDTRTAWREDRQGLLWIIKC